MAAPRDAPLRNQLLNQPPPPPSAAKLAAAKLEKEHKARAAQREKEREKSFASMFDVLKLELDTSGNGEDDFVPVLMDLTFYEHESLVSQALGLLIRHFQQRTALQSFGLKSQVLTKPDVVKLYSTFDDILSHKGTLFHAGWVSRLPAREPVHTSQECAAAALARQRRGHKAVQRKEHEDGSCPCES